MASSSLLLSQSSRASAQPALPRSSLFSPLPARTRSGALTPLLAAKPPVRKPLRHIACRWSPEDMQLDSRVREGISSLRKPAALAMLLASLLTCEPDMALAAGGGRVGGKVSRDSYSAPSAGYSGYSSGGYSVQTYVAPPVVVPYYAPSPFFGGFAAPTIFIGGGGGIIGLLVFALVAFFVINSVTGFLGDSDDVYTSEVTVMRVQVGLLGLARTLQKDLDKIALYADTSSAEGLQYILNETTLTLLRHPDYCVYGRSTSELKRSEEEGESAFNSLSLEERGKFSEETLVNVGSIRRSLDRPPKAQRFNSEYIVVTILVAAEGKFNLPEIRNLNDLKSALSTIGSVPTDRIQAVEVLWTPQDDDDTLSERELLQDYPLLNAL